MKTFETHLRAQQRRSIPLDWKGEILTNALTENEQSKQSIMAWLFPRPMRYGLAAAWVAIMALNASVPSSSPALAETGDSPVMLLASFQLAQQYLNEEVLP